jgi:glycosyltransferase involved in cell wall biosynthesis
LKRLKLAIVGTQGIPNAYGGFETLAEYLVCYLHDQFDITVYCSSRDQKEHPKEYMGARLIHIPLSSHGSVGMLYDSITLIHAALTHDTVIFLGFGAGLVAPFIPRLNRKMVLNFGGLDWKRSKWSANAQKMIRLCEKWLVKNSQVVVADNPLIADYIRETYHIEPVQIAYGGDQAKLQPITPDLLKQYPFLGGKYALALARIQPDNNIDMILEGYPDDLGYPLVFIGNWNGSEYGKKLRQVHSGKRHLILLDGIYDRIVLDAIRSHCTVYIHGHSAGGTNPSLCEAMYLGLPIIAYASGYNEKTMNGNGLFFKFLGEVNNILMTMNFLKMQKYAEKNGDYAKDYYVWQNVASAYGLLVNGSSNNR